MEPIQQSVLTKLTDSRQQKNEVDPHVVETFFRPPTSTQIQAWRCINYECLTLT